MDNVKWNGWFEGTLSFNNRLIVEKYTKTALKHKEVNGFALIDQKVNLKGLKVLADAVVTQGSVLLTVKKGSVAYIKEEALHTAPWAQKAYESDALATPFLIVDMTAVEFIVPPSE